MARLSAAEYQRRYRERHQERIRKYRRKYRADNLARIRAKDRARYHASRDRVLGRVYGPAAPKHYHEQLLVQDGKCALCGALPQKDRALCLDHNHDTGQLRGALCDGCNKGVGHIERGGRAWLKNAIEYLGKWDGDNERF